MVLKLYIDINQTAYPTQPPILDNQVWLLQLDSSCVGPIGFAAVPCFKISNACSWQIRHAFQYQFP